MNVDYYVKNALNDILQTYQNIVAFFYQTIDQDKYTNNALATFVVDFDFLLPGSQFIVILNENQINAQIQSYVNQCNVLIAFITTNVNTQINLFFESIQNTLTLSISNLNGFALSLLQAQYVSLILYTTPTTTSMSNIMFINKIDLSTWPVQIRLNRMLPDFNNIKQGTLVTLSK